LGTFGTESRAGRLYQNRTLLTLIAVVVVPVLARLLSMPEPLVSALRVVAPALGFALIGVWWVRYLHGVDEFERRLHWEALSVAYAVTIFAAVTLGALAREFQWNISPTTLILIEPLRAAVLWHKSKQYR